jgi:hypothetical protein
VDSLVAANVSEKHTFPIVRAEDGDSMFLRWHLPTSLQDAKTQKNSIIILIAVKISNLKKGDVTTAQNISVFPQWCKKYDSEFIINYTSNGTRNNIKF